MQHLAKYVEVINQPNHHNALALIKCEKQQYTLTENNMDIAVSQEKFYFADGSIIQKDIEQDLLPLEVEACNECWIQYTVLQQPIYEHIAPTKIKFNSHCRETHWVNYFKPA